jgi:hypothetical protein
LKKIIVTTHWDKPYTLTKITVTTPRRRRLITLNPVTTMGNKNNVTNQEEDDHKPSTLNPVTTPGRRSLNPEP